MKILFYLFIYFLEEESPMKLGLSVSTIKHTELLKRAPFVFPFIERVIVSVSGIIIIN